MSVETAPPGGARASSSRRVARLVRAAVPAFAVIGLLAVVGLVVGLVADYSSFDRTSGGYEAPYSGWTGTPIDWTTADVSKAGFRKQGYVMDVAVNCTTGMITFELFGARYDYRAFSARAIAVHKPREACTAQGFTPQF